MTIEQTTVICECGNCQAWEFKRGMCGGCNDTPKIVFDDYLKAYCQTCKTPWHNRQNDRFDYRLLKLAIDKWFKKGWLLHETVVIETKAILTLRKSV